ncbi:acyltransferase [Mucilaginibacter agri]|uniref:Maltose O-acetyltransferase n=1 Tax=Mucilaginibacter agri TaxID=2695265 RepID=A0A965ZCV7_9SPHI|nr:acyltransferase [Mucilaginibacter agri]NCD67812.1 maltose O-acetyltransferase [Mucilaginibacter agri]
MKLNLLYRLIFKVEKIITKKKENQLKSAFKYCGENIRLENNCHIIVPGNFEIGDNSSISSFTTVYATFGVKIGKNCLISSNCGISSYNHIMESGDRPADSGRDVEFSKPVTIGDNVWIGMNSCILPGVSIGSNSIIGSGSVVTKNVPSDEVWVGNPARFIKKLTIINA